MSLKLKKGDNQRTLDTVLVVTRTTRSDKKPWKIVDDVEQAFWLKKDEGITLETDGLPVVIPDPLYLDYLLKPKVEWDFSFVNGMLNLLIKFNRNDDIYIMHVLETCLDQIVPPKKTKKHILLLVQSLNHYHVVMVSPSKRTVQLYDTQMSTATYKVLKRQLVRLGITFCGMGKLLQPSDITVAEPVFVKLNKQDCGAISLLHVMELSGYFPEKRTIKKEERRLIVVMEYLRLLYATIEECTLNYSDDTPVLIERRLPINAIEILCETFLQRLEDKKKITTANHMLCGHCKKPLVTDEMKTLAETYCSNEYKDLQKTKVVHEVLPSFEITISLCCYNRFHGNCFGQHVSTNKICMECDKAPCYYRWSCEEMSLLKSCVSIPPLQSSTCASIPPVLSSTSLSVMVDNKSIHSETETEVEKEVHSDSGVKASSKTSQRIIVDEESTVGSPPILKGKSKTRQRKIVDDESTLGSPPIVKGKSTTKKRKVIDDESTLGSPLAKVAKSRLPLKNTAEKTVEKKTVETSMKMTVEKWTGDEDDVEKNSNTSLVVVNPYAKRNHKDNKINPWQNSYPVNPYAKNKEAILKKRESSSTNSSVSNEKRPPFLEKPEEVLLSLSKANTSGNSMETLPFSQSGLSKKQKSDAASKLLADLSLHGPLIETWLNTRQSKLLARDEEFFQSLIIGSMYEVDEVTKADAKALEIISGLDRYNVVKALDPLESDLCVYTGVDKYRILTLRKKGWLDCSVITRVLGLLKLYTPSVATPNVNLLGPYFFTQSKTCVTKQGMYHVIIVNESDQNDKGTMETTGKHWIVIEIDDRKVPRPDRLHCQIFGNIGAVARICKYYEAKIKQRFNVGSVTFGDPKKNKCYEEEQSGYDCGVIALRRAQMRILFGVDDPTEKQFRQLGKYEDSRLLYAHMIVSENNLKIEPATPSRLIGSGSNADPIQYEKRENEKTSAVAKGNIDTVSNTDIDAMANSLGASVPMISSSITCPTNEVFIKSLIPTTPDTSRSTTTLSLDEVSKVNSPLLLGIQEVANEDVLEDVSEDVDKGKNTTELPNVSSPASGWVKEKKPENNKGVETPERLSVNEDVTQKQIQSPGVNNVIDGNIPSPCPLPVSLADDFDIPNSPEQPYEADNENEKLNDKMCPIERTDQLALPPVGEGGSVDWIDPEAVGLVSSEKIKGFYFGNLLFVSKMDDYDRARRLMSTIFVRPVLPNIERFKCTGCGKYCPNYYVFLCHNSSLNFNNGECPPENRWESGRICPAFYLPAVVLNFFEEAVNQYFSGGPQHLQPFDFLNPKAEYCNYAVENVRHTSAEIRANVTTERHWLNEAPRSHGFIMFLYTKIFKQRLLANKMDSCHRVGYYPTVLTMPYIDTVKVELNFDRGAESGIYPLTLSEIYKEAHLRAKGRFVLKKTKEPKEKTVKKKRVNSKKTKTLEK
jgi:hypothetical protein